MARPETPHRRRRTFTAAALLLVVPLACSAVRSGKGSEVAAQASPQASAQPSATATRAPGDELTADVVRQENARPGDLSWFLKDVDKAGQMAGYFSSGSATPGTTLELHLSSKVGALDVRGFRIGYYGGKLGRKVFEKPKVAAGPRGAAKLVRASTRTYAAMWPVSLRVPTRGWLPGDYLFTLTAASGKQAWVPVTLRSPRGKGAVVIMNATTTWQAYNAYGGYSLYHGPDGATRSRAYGVSDQRPYSFGYGAGDFIGNERPLVSLAEQLGLPLAYATSTDLDKNPHLLDGARAVISLGHDEYWSSRMRSAVLSARDKGTNVAFLGANAAYRHIRFEHVDGVGDIEIDYKDGTDPIAKTNSLEATYQWRSGPHPRPESVLTGSYYQCNGVKGNLVAAAGSSWLTAGLVTPGQRLTGLLGDEYDQLMLSAPTPRPLQVLFHSPLTCQGRQGAADLVYYTTPSGAAGFGAATSAWICVMGDACAQPGSNSVTNKKIVTGITARLLTAYAKGPAGTSHPATDNAGAYSGRSGAPRASTP